VTWLWEGFGGIFAKAASGEGTGTLKKEVVKALVVKAEGTGKARWGRSPGRHYF
jgi:hypothetical protein